MSRLSPRWLATALLTAGTLACSHYTGTPATVVPVGEITVPVQPEIQRVAGHEGDLAAETGTGYTYQNVNVTGPALLNGLAYLSADQVAALPDVSPQIIDVSDVLYGNEVQALLSHIENDPAARRNSIALTVELRQRGLLGPRERIVGTAGGRLYKFSF